jgi:adenine-specific DNA methylase
MEKGKFRCPDCDRKTPLHELWRTGAARPRLFAQEYLDSEGNRGFAPIGQTGLRRYAEAEALLAAEAEALLIPDARIPAEGRADRRPLLYGYANYREMFNTRQLYCLGLIGREVANTSDPAVRRSLALAFSHSLASNNMFCGYAFGYRRLTPLFSVHAFRKISRPVEGHVWGLSIGRGSFANAVRALVEGKEYMRQPFEYRYAARRPERVSVALPPRTSAAEGQPVAPVRILNQSSADLSTIPSGSVDLILTDPPYFDNLSYSELSDFYHVWLRKLLGSDYPGHAREHTPMGASLFAGKRSSAPSELAAQDAQKDYARTLARVFLECRRVAKPGAGMLFTYHHRSAEAWETLGRAIIPAGFRVLDVFPVRSEGRSGFHSYGGSIKWDSVLICRHGPLPAYRVTTGQGVAAAVRWARTAAARWVTRLGRAKLAFGNMDYQSLLMSLVLQRFSERQLRPSKLSGALTKALSEPVPEVLQRQ